MTIRKNIIGVRDVIREWLPTIVHIDEYTLEHPQTLMSPVQPRRACNVTFFPVENLQYDFIALNTVTGTAIFNFSLRYLYPFSTAFDTIPIKNLEQISEVVNVKAMLELKSRSHLVDVVVNSIEFPVQVSKQENEQGDWVVDINISLNITFNISDLTISNEFLPTGNVPPPPVLQDIRIRTYETSTPVSENIDTAVLDMDYLKLIN